MAGEFKRESLFQKGPKWKREHVADYKFDFVDVDEFHDPGWWMAFKFIILYFSIAMSTLVYCAELWTAGILLIYDKWSLSTQPLIRFEISKWIYVGCIILSFLLLAWEIRKARNIIRSRNISYAATNVMASRFYSMKSYSHFCLFQTIHSSRKITDYMAFFVFFTLKGWKRLLFAQSPRQIIAGITVYALLKSAWTNKQNNFEFTTNWDAYGEDWSQRVALLLMSFTCILWCLSILSFVLGCFLYLPILCHIQGNLKEYCCHKIDKRRIKELERKEAAINDQNTRKNNASNLKRENLNRTATLPTLPKVDDSDLYCDKAPLFPRQNKFHSETSVPMSGSTAVNLNYQPSVYSRSDTYQASYKQHSEPATPMLSQRGYYDSDIPPVPQRAYTQPMADTCFFQNDQYQQNIIDSYSTQHTAGQAQMPNQYTSTEYSTQPGSYFEPSNYYSSIQPIESQQGRPSSTTINNAMSSSPTLHHENPYNYNSTSTGGPGRPY
ncbi:hypothetical protein F4703DRAFT_1742898 [Phycomyces blakesleeanus]